MGAAQIAIQLLRGKPVHMMEWLSLLLVIAGGLAAIVTDNPRFLLFKPSVVYAIVGVVMLKKGWMVRYLPTTVRGVAPDVAVVVGYAWAALMLATAAVNAAVAIACDVQTWAMVMLIFGVASKLTVFVAGFLAIRLTTVHRVRAMPVAERNALWATTKVHA